MKLLRISLILGLIMMGWADIINLKDGTKIEGDILKVETDSISVVTAGPNAKIVKIAATDILKIDKKEVPKDETGSAIKKVGYGCLGGVIGAATGGACCVWVAPEFIDSETGMKIAYTLYAGLIITGILIGVSIAK